MYFIKVGVDYRATPLEVREMLTFSEQNVEQAMLELNKKMHVLENIILSTCNRTEIFAVVKNEDNGKQDVTTFLMEWFHVKTSDILPYLKFASGDDVIRHAFRLAAGLDSMVLGETQILGQVRDAFLKAQQLKTTKKHFNELFRRVITLAKRAHSDTVIGEQAVSVSYVAVELSKKIFDDMREKHAVILGAGEMGEASLKNLRGAGVTNITIVNRSFNKAEQLAETFQATAVPIDELDQVLLQADILISSTGANDVILTKERLAAIHKQRNEQPLFLIDIAVPRDIEESAGDLENIFLYDTDDLQSVADDNMGQRKKAASIIESAIENELASYTEWLNMLEVVPIIKALNEKSSRIQEKTLESIFRKIPDLDAREMKVLTKHTKSIVNQLLEQPIRQVKQMGADQCSEDVKEMYINIFGLEDSISGETRL